MKFSVKRLLVLLSVSLLLGACSSFNTEDVLPDKQVEYKREKQADRGLEIPPDLTTSSIDNEGIGLDSPTGVSTTYSEYKTRRQGAIGSGAGSSGVLVDIKGVTMQRDGQDRPAHQYRLNGDNTRPRMPGTDRQGRTSSKSV